MNDDRGYGSVARRLFVFVGPASVIGEGFSREKLRIVRRRLAGKQNDHLAAHVDAFVVVPLVLWRHDSVPDEDGRRIELSIRLLLVGHADEFIQPLESNWSTRVRRHA